MSSTQQNIFININQDIIFCILTCKHLYIYRCIHPFSIPKYSELWGKQHGGHHQFFFLSRESRPENDPVAHEFSPQIPSYPEDPKDDTEKEIKVPVPKKKINPSQPKTHRKCMVKHGLTAHFGKGHQQKMVNLKYCWKGNPFWGFYDRY